MAAKNEANFDQVCKIVQQQSLAGFTLCDSLFVNEIVVPSHSHEQAHVTLFLAGACHETYLGKTRTLRPLSVTYFHPGESHSLQVVGGPFRSFDIELSGDWVSRFLEHPIAPTALLNAQNQSIAQLTARLYGEFKEMDEVSQLAIEGLALEILAGLARSSESVRTKRAPRWLGQVVELIHDEFDRSLTLTELASAAGVHPSHLTQVFREHYRCTPGEFIRRIRVERAIQQMADPEASLADIALAAGFSDQSHFSRVFKRATGMTPAKFRQGNLDPNSVPITHDLYKTATGNLA